MWNTKKCSGPGDATIPRSDVPREYLDTSKIIKAHPDSRGLSLCSFYGTAMHQRFSKVTGVATVVPTQAIPRCLQALLFHQFRVQIAKTSSVLNTIPTLPAIQVFKFYLCINQLSQQNLLPRDTTMKLRAGVFPLSIHEVSTYTAIGSTYTPYLTLCHGKGTARKALQTTVVSLLLPHP